MSQSPSRSSDWSVAPSSWAAASTTLPPTGGPGGSATARRLLVGTVVVLVVALAMAGTVAVVQTARLSDSREDAEALREQAAAQSEEIADLQAQLAQAQSGGGGDPLSGLDEMLSGDLADLLDELDGLLGPDSPLGDLDGLEDLLGPDGPLGDLGGLGDLDGLEDLGGIGPGGLDIGAPDTSGCLQGAEDLPDIDGATAQDQVADAVDAVEQIRGRPFPEPVEPVYLDDEQIRDRITEEVADGYPADDADVDRALLSALGAVPADIDLVATQTELLGDQVAGFYDPDTGELVVRVDNAGEPLDVLGVLTLVHELEHALADATIGLPEVDLEDGSDPGEPLDEDGLLASLAMVEGDAVAVQTIGMSVAISPLDLVAAFSDPDVLAGASAGLDGVPHYLASALTFPYVEGPTYVCDVFATRGWEGVDALLTSPPSSTAEVLYGTAVEVREPARPGGPDGFELVTRRTFGAAQLSWLFAAPGGREDLALDDPRASAQGWQGGEVTLWRDGDRDVVVLSLVDGGGLCDAVTQWWDRTEPTLSRGTGAVVCMGEQVLLGVADDESSALAALGQ